MSSENNKSGSIYDLLKNGQGKEAFKIDDLATMIGLPVEMIREQLNIQEDSITLEQLQQKTRNLVDDYFIDENEQ